MLQLRVILFSDIFMPPPFSVGEHVASALFVCHIPSCPIQRFSHIQRWGHLCHTDTFSVGEHIALTLSHPVPSHTKIFSHIQRWGHLCHTDTFFSGGAYSLNLVTSHPIQRFFLTYKDGGICVTLAHFEFLNLI